MPHLFEQLRLRGVTLPNRIAVSSMCQYSSSDGYATDWHFVHLGSRAVGGAGLVMTEAAAITPEGRISPQDLGIWAGGHIAPLARIVRFIHEQGSNAGIQLAHAGRKGSTLRPWEGHIAIPKSEGGWRVVAPSGVAFAEGYATPEELSEEGIREIVDAFRAATGRALEAGFRVVEVHAAHGYLIHEFLSPLSNRRKDRYGGTFENRTRFILEAVTAVRNAWPERFPLLVRISATDWIEGGWDIEQSVELVRRLKDLGVDLVDCSSGGSSPFAQIPFGPGYQVPFADRIRHETGMLTGAVGMIVAPAQADHILRSGQADIVLLAREMLRHPYWPLSAARELGQVQPWPAQYLRAAPERTPLRNSTPLDAH
ncbi:MAG: NADH:flavin oxidoreductase/NADH oxidase [Acidobacteriia bacterium]|nr:NADH:flavin oxidoreductase/NADH oxidase [Terriglobia bacterium]